MRPIAYLTPLSLGLSLLLTQPAQADSAMTLPEDLFRVGTRVMSLSSGRIAKSEQIALPAEQMEAAGLADLAGYSLGQVDVDLEFGATLVVPNLFYGVKDWLMVGGLLPVFKDAHITVHKLDFKSDLWAYNSEFGNDRSKSPIVPSFDERAVTGNDAIQGLMTEGLGYKPLESWQGSGLGDLILIAQAKMHSTERSMVSLQPMVVLPTGQEDDPDNLLDIGLGEGQTDIGAAILIDYYLTPRLRFNLNTGYMVQLAATKEIRAYNDPVLKVGSKTELPGPFNEHIGTARQMRHDPGDIFRFKPALELAVSKSLFVEARYEYLSRGKDDFEGIEAMAVGTDYVSHEVFVGATVNLVDRFLRGKFPVPLTASILVSQAYSELESAQRRTIMLDIGMFVGPKNAGKSRASDEEDAEVDEDEEYYREKYDDDDDEYEDDDEYDEDDEYEDDDEYDDDDEYEDDDEYDDE